MTNDYMITPVDDVSPPQALCHLCGEVNADPTHARCAECREFNDWGRNAIADHVEYERRRRDKGLPPHARVRGRSEHCSCTGCTMPLPEAKQWRPHASTLLAIYVTAVVFGIGFVFTYWQLTLVLLVVGVLALCVAVPVGRRQYRRERSAAEHDALAARADAALLEWMKTPPTERHDNDTDQP